MRNVKVWRVLYTSIARVHAESAEEAMDRAHAVTPTLASEVDIENIHMVAAQFCGTEEVPRRMAA